MHKERSQEEITNRSCEEN